MASSLEERGSGWIAFAGVVLVVSGAMNIVNGLWALDHKGTVAELLYETNLETWGWVHLIWGIVVVLAGFMVFARSQFARWVGILAASITMVLNMFWIFAYPISALAVIFIAALVLYALIVYGGREEAAV